jgi:SAM-dependent methyltransferase
VNSREWDERYAAAELVWSAEPNCFVAAELTGLTPGTALDLAAGEGRNAIWLAQQGWAVTAVDFSAVGLAKAARLAQAKNVTVDWVRADVLEYQPKPARYQLVLVSYLQLPETELVPVLRRAAAAVAPGGSALVVGHDVSNLTDGIGGPADADVLYTPETIAAALDGLRIQRAERVRRPVRTADGERTAIDTLVRATREPLTP